MIKELNKKKLAKNLAELREEHQISQIELARSLNLSTTAISKWELGKTSPTLENLNKLAKFYKISLKELFKIIL